MSTPTVYVICDQNCKFEGMTKEQILTAIVQAVNEGTIGNIDTGFITTIKTINGTPLKFFVGEQSEYDALTDEDKTNLFAIITNDTSKEGILNAIEELQTNFVEAIEALNNGTWEVAKAAYAKNAYQATLAGAASKLTIENFNTYANSAYMSEGTYLFKVTLGQMVFTTHLCITEDRCFSILGFSIDNSNNRNIYQLSCVGWQLFVELYSASTTTQFEFIEFVDSPTIEYRKII